MSDCLFCKISAKLISAKIIYEDDIMLAFHDIAPKADVHFLIIPKQHIESMLALTSEHESLMGKILVKANELAIQHDLTGYKTFIHTGIKGGQEVFHLHVHVMGNR